MFYAIGHLLKKVNFTNIIDKIFRLLLINSSTADISKKVLYDYTRINKSKDIIEIQILQG